MYRPHEAPAASQNLPATLNALDEALAKNSTDARLRLRRGMVLRQLNRLQESVAALSTLRAEYPEAIDITCELAASLGLAGETAQCLDLCEMVLLRAPSHRHAHIIRIDAHSRTKNFSAALAAIDDALSHHSADMPLQLKRGIALRHLSRLQESVDALSTLRAEYPEAIDVACELAASLGLAGETAQCLDLCEMALLRAPSLRHAHIMRIEAHSRTKNFPAVLAAIDDALAHMPSDRVLRIRRGIVLRQLGRPQQSVAEFDALLQTPESALSTDGATASNHSNLERELAISLFQSGNIPRGLTLARPLWREKPPHRGLMMQVLQAERQALNLTSALEITEEALPIWPQDTALQRIKLSVLQSAKRLTEAEAWLAQISGPNDDLWISLELELRRFARLRLRLEKMRKAAARPAIEIDLIEARLLRAEGRKEAEQRLLAAAFMANSDHAECASALLLCLVDAEDLAQAEALVAQLSHAALQHPSMTFPFARFLAFKGEAGRAAQFLLAKLDETTANSWAVFLLTRLAGLEGFGTALSQEIMAKLRAAIDAVSTSLSPFTRDILHLQIASSSGNWPEVAFRATRALSVSPRDMQLLSFKARADFEAGHHAQATQAITQVLALNPCDRQAIDLYKALLLVTGDVDGYFSYSIAQIKNNATALEFRFAEDLCMCNRIADFKALITDHISCPTSPDAPWLRRYKKISGAKISQTATEKVIRRKNRALGASDLRGLLAAPTHGEITTQALLPAAFMARSLQSRQEGSTEAWLQRAAHATHARAVATTRGALDHIPEVFAHSEPFRALKARLDAAQPTLIVTSHLGPPLSLAIPDIFKNVAFLVSQDWHYEDASLEAVSIDGASDSAAADILRAVRKGLSIYSAPDFPLQIFHPEGFKSNCSGTLFGVQTPLIDTVPKISQAMNIPVYWYQPRWRKGEITLDVQQMPAAAPEESSESWCAGWAQNYLDLIADLIDSEPENQNLNAPIMRYLLLKGAGK